MQVHQCNCSNRRFSGCLQQNVGESGYAISSWSANAGFSASMLTRVAKVDLLNKSWLVFDSSTFSTLSQHICQYPALPDHDSMNNPSIYPGNIYESNRNHSCKFSRFICNALIKKTYYHCSLSTELSKYNRPTFKSLTLKLVTFMTLIHPTGRLFTGQLYCTVREEEEKLLGIVFINYHYLRKHPHTHVDICTRLSHNQCYNMSFPYA